MTEPRPALLRRFETACHRWSVVRYPPGWRYAAHSHESTQISFLLAGHVREIVGADEHDADRFSLVSKPLGVRHANEFGPHGALMLSIGLDPASLDGAGPGPSRWFWAGAEGFRAGLSELLAGFSGTTPLDADALDMAVADIVAALEARDVEPSARAGQAPAWLTRAKSQLLDSDADLAALCAEASVHRVSLARAFRRHYGRSITATRRHARVSRAVAALTGQSARRADGLAEIALASGFSDQSHMTRAFRLETGLTPGLVQRLVAAGQVTSVQDRLSVRR